MHPVENILTPEISKHKTRSIQYLFFNANHILYQFQKGFADIKKKRAVDDRTTYHAFSVTKTFTAVAILQLHPAYAHPGFHRYAFFDSIFTRYTDVDFKPNQKYAYSNLGFVILGHLIEKISGLSYEQFITANIFMKLNLQPTEMAFTVSEFSHDAKATKNISVY